MPTKLQPIDSVEILVLIDNQTDSMSSVPEGFTHEWANLHNAGMEQISGTGQCCANHGLALIITARRGDREHTLLFDAGPVDFAVEFNASRLGKSFASIEAIALSHGHWDHAGGIPAAIDLIRKDGQTGELPVYLHPGMFRKRAFPLSSGELIEIREIATPQELAEQGATPVVTDQPLSVLDYMFYVSGEIPRVTDYEIGFPGHVRRTEDGTGWEDDPLLMDERYVAVNIAGKGLVVFSACSHAGIVNVLHAAQRDFPGVPIHGLTGGFHLAGGNEKIIDQTVADFEQFDIDLIMPGHCTGWRATNALERQYGERVVPIAVGMKINL